LLVSSYFCPVNELGKKIAQFVKWARVIWPAHEMGNYTDGLLQSKSQDQKKNGHRIAKLFKISLFQ
jgi:hypothetical protein